MRARSKKHRGIQAIFKDYLSVKKYTFSLNMKYALFEFINEKSCEIGETRWIVREDHATFENTSWDTEKEIMVTDLLTHRRSLSVPARRRGVRI